MEPVRIWIYILNHDVAVAFLPAVYFRVSLAPTGERRAVTVGAPRLTVEYR